MRLVASFPTVYYMPQSASVRTLLTIFAAIATKGPQKLLACDAHLGFNFSVAISCLRSVIAEKAYLPPDFQFPVNSVSFTSQFIDSSEFLPKQIK